MKTTKFKYEPSTQTIRSVPENYWLASVKDGKLVFDSWDGVAKEWLISNNFKKQIERFWLELNEMKEQVKTLPVHGFTYKYIQGLIQSRTR